MRPPNRKGSEEFFMDIQQIISQMTLEEKAALCQGRSSWFTRAVERLGVPEMMMSDGPHGLRKQDLEKENRRRQRRHQGSVLSHGGGYGMLL